MKYKKSEDNKHAGGGHAAKEATATTAPKSPFEEPVTIALVLVVVALLAYIAYNSFNNQAPPNGNTGVVVTNPNQTANKTTQAKVNMELFVMSYCPYGVQAENSVTKVVSKFNGDVGLNLHFIASQDANGTFESMHGPNEVAEDLRQVCIMQYYPNNFIGYLACVDNGYPNIESVWQSCATQNNIDIGKLNECRNGNEATTLLAANVKRTNELNVQASPTIYLNGTAYNGGRDENSLTRALCTFTPGSNTCQNIPPEVGVGLTIINDKNCTVCDTSQIINALKSQFQMDNLTETDVDCSSAEGLALIQKFNITGVPAYIFNASVVNHQSYGSLSQYLRNVSSSYLLLVQPSELVSRVKANNTLQLFVMSWCPFGTAAEKAMNELLGAIPDAKFGGVYFIASQNANGSFESLHGDGEVREDLRQVCMMKYYNNSVYFKYLMCVDANVSNSDSIWQSCASSSGIDTAKIQNCSTGSEGAVLLAANIVPAQELNVYSSPTILLDNSTIFNSVDANQMKQVLCSYSPALAGCNKVLNGTTTPATTPSGGGCG